MKSRLKFLVYAHVLGSDFYIGTQTSLASCLPRAAAHFEQLPSFSACCGRVGGLRGVEGRGVEGGWRSGGRVSGWSHSSYNIGQADSYSQLLERLSSPWLSRGLDLWNCADVAVVLHHVQFATTRSVSSPKGKTPLTLVLSQFESLIESLIEQKSRCTIELSYSVLRWQF